MTDTNNNTSINEIIELLQSNPPNRMVCVLDYENNTKAVVVINLSPIDAISLLREGSTQIIVHMTEEFIQELTAKNEPT